MDWTLRIELGHHMSSVMSPEYEGLFAIYIGSPKYRDLRGKVRIVLYRRGLFTIQEVEALRGALELGMRVAYVPDGVGGFIDNS